MNHLILAETQFFAMINGKDNGSTETAYGGFVQEVINLCYGGNDAKHIIVALAFAEIELQHHPQNLSASEENVVTVYIRKALSFIRKMQKMVSASAITSVPPLTSTSETKATVPALQWTGNAVELVELIRHRLHQWRQGFAERACSCPLFLFRCGVQRLLPLLYGHQTQEKRQSHLLP